MMKVRLLLAVCVVVLCAPALASAQLARAYNILWTAECGLRHDPLDPATAEAGYVEGHGLATLQRVAGGWELRFSGPAGDSGVTFVDDGGGASAVFPNPGCPSLGLLEGVAPFTPLGTMADPAGFTLRFLWGSMGQMEGGSASALEASVVASVPSPAPGVTVAGTTAVKLTATGPLPGVSVVFRLAVDGQEVAVIPARTDLARVASAAYAWDTLGASNGAHRLDLTVTDKFGVPIATATTSPTVSNGGSATTPGTLKVAFTAPARSATVSGTVWFSIWVEGAAIGTNTWTLSDNGARFASPTCGCTHLVPAWDSRAVPNGTHTISVSVKDASGRTGTGSITVLVKN
jgi:hypothetical protein